VNCSINTNIVRWIKSWKWVTNPDQWPRLFWTMTQLAHDALKNLGFMF